MNDYNKETIDKIIKMFTPSGSNFLGYVKREVICGPTDRAAFGVETNFPIDWLMKDYGFTQKEAEWFVKKVQELHGQKISEK